MPAARITHRSNVLTFAITALVLLVVAGAEPGLALTLAPAVTLLALLGAGVRPGERLIERLLMRPARRPRAASSPRPRTADAFRLPGRLLDLALASRPPPLRPASMP